MKYDGGHNSTIQPWRLLPHLDLESRATDPKMVESSASISMTHAPSSYACTCSHTTSIDGDMRRDSGWISVGFGIGGQLTHD
jgi:hypothetical protein